MIGFFDSGCGGLTVLKAVRAAIPSADVLYFGDTKNAPYGSRSRDELTRLTVEALKLLQDRGATSIVSACNSVSASLAISLFDSFSLQPTHLIEMVGPTVSAFRGSQERLLLVATPATIQSDIYQSAFRMIGHEVTCVAIPTLAGAIERGEGARELGHDIRNALQAVDLSQFDRLILACTHYPLVQSLFEKVVPMPVFDPAAAVADRVEHRLWPQEARNGHLQFLISEDSDVFRHWVAKLFPDTQYEVEILS